MAEYDADKTGLDLTAKATPIDADAIVVSDSADSNYAKKTTWAQVKSVLKTYFDTLYATAAQGSTADSALQNVVEDTTPQLGGQLDVNGNAIGDGTLELLAFTETASAVNHVDIKNAATGNHPQVSAVGDDTNIDLQLAGKGTGNISLQGDLDFNTNIAFGIDTIRANANALTLENSSLAEMLELTAVGSAVNEFTISNAATGNGPELQATGNDTNINIELIPKGSGRVKEGSTNLQKELTEGAFVDGDKTKLDGIETGADVTDTTNVTAAGALMDSEVDADIKTLSLPANTTISTFGATLVDDADAATARTTLGVDAAGTDNSTDVTLAGTPDYITITGQTITRNQIDLTTDVTGVLPEANLPNASASAEGVVELATSAETTTGTDTGRAITPDGLAGSDYGKRIVGIQVFDSATDTATGDGKAFFRVPSALNGYNLVGVAANVYTAGTTGTTDIQIRNVTDSQDMLSTKLTIDSAETDSSTAATAAVINTTYDDVATGDKIAIDVDAVSTTAAQGLYVEMIFQLP